MKTHTHAFARGRRAQLAAAIAALLAAQGAYALAPAATEAATLKVFLTGGGAADGNLEATVKGLLNAGTIDTYTYGGDKRSFWAVSGTLKAGTTLSSPGGSLTPIPANTTIAFYKRTLGAAFTSTTVAENVTIEHLKVSTATATATPNVYNVAAGSVAEGQLQLIKSDAGYSDTPVDLFAAPVNVPDGVTPPSLAAIQTLKVLPINVALHGVAVTKGLRDLLQAQQGLSVGNESEANIPSLSRSAIASIYQGRITNWSQLVYNGTPLNLNAIPGQSFSDDVYVIPRSPGAAIQASINARILNTPSNPGAFGPARQNLSFAPYVFEAPLPADTDSILDKLDTGVAFSWIDASGAINDQPSDGTRKLALGSQSTERNAGVAGPDANKDKLNYRFIKIDGRAPTLKNAFNGTYPVTLEATIVHRTAATPGGALTGQKLTFVTELAKRIGDPATLAANNLRFFHGYGQTGYLALSTNGYAVGSTLNTAAPVSGYTYGQDGSAVDIGRPSVIDLSTNGVGTPLVPSLITE